MSLPMMRSAFVSPEPGPSSSDLLPFAQAKELAMAEFERAYLVEVLRRTGGNISEAARIAQMDRSNFRRVLKRYGLRPGGRSE